MQLTEAVLRAILTRMTAAGGPFDPAACFVGVATTIADHGTATVQADVTEPVGDAATRVAITAWSAIYPLSDGRFATDGDLCVFNQGTGDDPVTIQYTFFNTAGAAGTLKGFTPLLPPIDLRDGGAPLSVVPRLTVDPQGNWSADVIWDG